MYFHSIKHTLTSLLPTVFMLAGIFIPQFADAALLVQGDSGTFNMNLYRDVLAQATGGNQNNPGHYLVHYYDTLESDYRTRSDSSIYFNNPLRDEVSAQNLLHDITPASLTAPANQAPGRYVKSSSPDFSLDTQSLTGTGSLGMTGIELYKGRYNGALIYGDYALHYNPEFRQEVMDEFGYSYPVSGWYLQNNVSFSAVVYDLQKLALVYHNATDWMLQGDLALTPENSLLLKIPPNTRVGDFCLGFGEFSGCGQTTVPLPGAAWLWLSGLCGWAFNARRRRSQS